MIKKLLLFSTLVLICGSCRNPVNEKGEEIESVTVSTTTYDNHKYLIFKYYKNAESFGVVHDPNCKCYGDN